MKSFVTDPDTFMTEIVEHISNIYPYILLCTYDQDDVPLDDNVEPFTFSFNGERKLFFEIPVEYFTSNPNVYTIRGTLKSELGSDFDIPNFFEIDKSSWVIENDELIIYADDTIEVAGSVYIFI